jgi:predicted NBD/HSP70 family sugar kinase
VRVSDQEFNRLQVLKAIRRAEPVARSELTALTGLSGATITEIVRDLVARGFLLEEKAPPGGMGRRRVQLRLNPDAARVVGAYVLPGHRLRVEINNLRGDTLFVREPALTRAPSIAAFAEEIADTVAAVIAESPFASADVDSVGVALPALVDSIGGQILWLQTYPLETVPVAALMEARLKLPVIVDNSINVITRAEHWFGEDRQVDDFSLFVVGLAIGFGRYVGGALWSGAHGANPEISHVKVGVDGGMTCTCGARGCLTTYASMQGVVHRVWEDRGLPFPRKRDLETSFQTCVADARAGDQAARAAFDLAGRALGVAVANYINAWDPRRILMLAMDAGFADLITPPFYAALHENTLPPLRGRAPVQFRVSDEERYSQGAAAMVLERLYGASGRAERRVADLENAHP